MAMKKTSMQMLLPKKVMLAQTLQLIILDMFQIAILK